MQYLSDSDLPDGDVVVDVRYSSLNYKDGLAVTGLSKIARAFPMVCGIDLAGVVAASDSPDWQPGDEVIATGFGLSENHPGGYTERQRLFGTWLVRKPPSLSLAQAMAIGTAGFTAMLCVMALEEAGLTPSDDRGDVLVTGAAGGVGSLAVAILSRLGYRVTASTGRVETHDYLRALGASTVIDRADLGKDSGRSLDRQRWASVVDSVGSTTLASAIKQTQYLGSVAACGLAGGSDLPVSVMPFILRGVRLLGIDSVHCPLRLRTEAWARLATDLPVEKLDALMTTRRLADIPKIAPDILAGAVRGRVVIDVAGAP